MSEQDFIKIPVPAGYEQCGCDNADHILVDGWAVCELINGGRRRIMDPVRPHGETYIDQLGHRITAYLREVPKPEPFRVVLEDCQIVQNTIYPEGQCRVTLTAWGKGLLDADFPGKRYRVTIEEVDAND